VCKIWQAICRIPQPLHTSQNSFPGLATFLAPSRFSRPGRSRFGHSWLGHSRLGHSGLSWHTACCISEVRTCKSHTESIQRPSISHEAITALLNRSNKSKIPNQGVCPITFLDLPAWFCHKEKQTNLVIQFTKS
jgi:hypothetical protein